MLTIKVYYFTPEPDNLVVDATIWFNNQQIIPRAGEQLWLTDKDLKNLDSFVENGTIQKYKVESIEYDLNIKEIHIFIEECE